MILGGKNGLGVWGGDVWGSGSDPCIDPCIDPGPDPGSDPGFQVVGIKGTCTLMCAGASSGAGAHS